MVATNKLKSLAGSDIVIVRNWHITIFTFLFSFLALFVFLDVFQPTTLASGPGDFIVPGNNETGPYQLGTTDSDKGKKNKFLSDRGRVILFAWSFGLGAIIALVIHFLLVLY
jgi:hypothetical protein